MGIEVPLQHLILAMIIMVYFFFMLHQLKNVIKCWYIVYLILSISSSYFLFDVFKWFTDEALYAPVFYKLLLEGKNPYTYPVVVVPGTAEITWSYLPLLGFIQIPYIGDLPPKPWFFYYFTILIFAILTAYALKDDPYALCLFFNPITILVLAFGYNDIVPVYFLIVGIKHKNKIASYIGCATKQFNLPIMTLIWLYNREYSAILSALFMILAISLPFIIWSSPQVFFNKVVFGHFEKINDFQEGKALFPNYLLYPMALLSVYYKRIKNSKIINRFMGCAKFLHAGKYKG